MTAGVPLSGAPSVAGTAGPSPSMPRSASELRDWHSPALREAYHAVLREGLERNWNDPVWQNIYRPLVERIEKADFALARRAGKARTDG